MQGSDILAIAEKHVGETYVLGAVVDYRNGGWTGPWDCAEFTTWCAFQAYGFLFGCDGKGTPGSAYTGEWKTQSSNPGRRIPVSEAARTPGAFLLRYPGSGGIEIGHIAICSGDGRTVEAASAATGVVRGKIEGRRWDTGVLLPGVDYEAAASADPMADILRFDALPQYSARVAALQERLKAEGFDPGPIDGLFGTATEAAVASFQAARGLVVDGEAGPQTLAALGLAEAAAGVKPVFALAAAAPASPIKSNGFAELAEEYRGLFATLTPRPEKQAAIAAAAARVLAGKDNCRAVAKAFGGMPWYFVGVINELESTSDFTTHLHNGDPLTARTTHVPAGRPKKGKPPFTWEESAIDALAMKGYDGESDWGLARMLHRLEAYNGFGSRKRGIFTPYLWSGCTHYARGKFVADGQWDPNAVSKQIGAAVILHALQQQGEISLPDA